MSGLAGVSMLRRTELARKAIRREAAALCLTSEAVIGLGVILYSVTDLADADPTIRASARRYLMGDDPFHKHAAAAGLVPEQVRALLQQSELLPAGQAEAA
jgi:hypothetical protein